jgi:hypothetical protein
MPCLGPLVAYYAKERNPSGKRSLVFDSKASHSGVKVEIACGQCVNCRTQHAADGALRCYHESKSHEVNSFITLTYSDAKLPADGGLVHRDFQLFMKRLRDKSEFSFKFVMCGEYGEKYNRPHYHALLFGCDFSDRRFYKTTPSGARLDVSQVLEDTWGLGFCTVGDVTYESARYVTGYIHKKIKGAMAPDHYMGRRPEYIVWSNGIGAGWFEKYGRQSYSNDFMVLDGKRVKIPRYYDSKFEIVDSARFDVVKRERVRKAKLHEPDLANRRSYVREKVAIARMAQFKGALDDT